MAIAAILAILVLATAARDGAPGGLSAAAACVPAAAPCRWRSLSALTAIGSGSAPVAGAGRRRGRRSSALVCHRPVRDARLRPADAIDRPIPRRPADRAGSPHRRLANRWPGAGGRTGSQFGPLRLRQALVERNRCSGVTRKRPRRRGRRSAPTGLASDTSADRGAPHGANSHRRVSHRLTPVLRRRTHETIRPALRYGRPCRAPRRTNRPPLSCRRFGAGNPPRRCCAAGRRRRADRQTAPALLRVPDSCKRSTASGAPSRCRRRESARPNGASHGRPLPAPCSAA